MKIDSDELILELLKKINKLEEENKQLKQELEEYNKRGQTLKNISTQKDSKMYELICKDFIPKDKIEEMLMRNKAVLKVAQEQIEEKIVIVDSDSLNAGRIQAHSFIIAELEKLLGDD
jgi:hypothetical protein